MSDRTTSGSSGETTSGFAGETTPPAGSTGGASSEVTGGQSPSANPGLTLEQVSKLFKDEVAPLKERLDHIDGRSTNQQAAVRRMSQRQGAASDGSDAGGDEEVDLSNLDESKMTPRERVMFRRLQTLEQNDAQRSEAERKQTVSTAIESAVKEGGFANGDLLTDLVKARGKLTIGTDGQVLLDDGKTARPVAEVVREFGARDVFRPASDGEGTGTIPGRVDGQGAAKPLDAKQIAEMSDADIIKMSAQF